DVDDDDAAPWYGLSPGKLTVERQSLETRGARQRERGDGKVVDEGETAQESWIEADRLPRGIRGIDPAEMARTGIEHPHTSAMNPRRMRHGEAFGNDAIVGDVDHNATLGALLPPAIDNVRRRAGADITQAALVHSDAIKMTAVFGRKFGNEFRFPDRPERMRHTRRCNAGIFRV